MQALDIIAKSRTRAGVGTCSTGLPWNTMRSATRTSLAPASPLPVIARRTPRCSRTRHLATPSAYVTTEERAAIHGCQPRAGPPRGSDIKELVAALRAQASAASAQASSRVAASSPLGMGPETAAALERAAVLGTAAVLHSGRELHVEGGQLTSLLEILGEMGPAAAERSSWVAATPWTGTEPDRASQGAAVPTGERDSLAGGSSGQWNALDLLLAPYAHLFADMPEQDLESKYDMVAALLRFSPPTGRQKYCMFADLLDAMHRHADAYAKGADDPWGWLVLHLLGAEVPSKYCPLDNNSLSSIGPAPDSKYDMTHGLFHERGPVVMVGQAANGVAGAIDYTARGMENSIATIGALAQKVRRAAAASDAWDASCP